MQIYYRVNTWFCFLASCILFLSFCQCTDDTLSEMEKEGVGSEAKITFKIKGPYSKANTTESRIDKLQIFFFDGDVSIPLSTQTVVSPNGDILSTITPIAEEYIGKRLTVLGVANEDIPTPQTLTELKGAITRIQQSQLKKNGLPMSSEEISFTARRGLQVKDLSLKRVHSALYAQIAPGCVGQLTDFAISVTGTQQQGGYLFADKMINDAISDVPFWGNFNGEILGPALIGYFYSTQGNIEVTVTPDPIRYPGTAPKQITIDATKAIYRNRKYMLNISPAGSDVVFDVQLLAWSESEEIVDFSQFDKNTLENLSVHTGYKNILMTQHGEVYALSLNGESVSNLQFSLPEGATISPDPNTVLRIPGKYQSQEFVITSGTGVAGKPFTVQYYPDPVYTLVVLGDTEWNMRGYTIQQAITDANKIAQIKREGKCYYKQHPAHKYDPELLMVVGDVSPDRDNNPNDFLKVFDGCYNAGIKCMNIFGNHDWDPEMWSDGPGFSFFAGEPQLNNSRKRIQVAANKSKITLEYIIAPDKWWYDPMPYAFSYRNVKYYCGNSFWFLPYYRPFGKPEDWFTNPSLWTKPKFKNADPIIESLERLVDKNSTSPVIWMQHYPFVSDWWNTFEHDGKYNTMEKRKQKIKDLIFRTKNPVMFAGHIHYSRIDKHSNGLGKTFSEYVTPYFRERGGSGYFVLVSEKEGVLCAEEFSADRLVK